MAVTHIDCIWCMELWPDLRQFERYVAGVPAVAVCGRDEAQSTMLSMLSGLLRPDAGSVRIHGRDLWADPLAVKAQIGVLPDGVRLFDRLRVNGSYIKGPKQ